MLIFFPTDELASTDLNVEFLLPARGGSPTHRPPSRQSTFKKQDDSADAKIWTVGQTQPLSLSPPPLPFPSHHFHGSKADCLVAVYLPFPLHVGC